MLSTYPLTAEQIEIQSLARDFARREILPVRSVYEKESISESNLPEKICQSGLVNTRIGAEFGGPGLTLFDTCLIAESLASECCGVASLMEASELAITPLLVAGTAQQKEIYLTTLACEPGLAGIALPCDGRNIDQNLLARAEGGSFILNGSCPLVLNASIARWFLICCRMSEPGNNTSPDCETSSMGYFIVPKSTAGLTFSQHFQLLGRKAADIKSAYFDNVRLELTAKINITTQCADYQCQENFNVIAAGCVGLGQAAFEQSRNYARQRKTFGIPIENHQAIAFMLADMDTDIEAARLMVYQAAQSPSTSPPEPIRPLKLAISALAFALEMVGKVTIDTVQIFGGSGYTKDYGVEKLMRDARTYQSMYGPTVKLKAQLGCAV